jgi:hypothetical protein
MANFSLIQGNTEAISAVALDQFGEPVDMTAAPIEFIMWKRSANTPAISWTEVDPQVTGAADGTITIAFASADTELDLGEYRAEIRATFDGSVESLILIGDVLNSLFYGGVNS